MVHRRVVNEVSNVSGHARVGSARQGACQARCIATVGDTGHHLSNGQRAFKELLFEANHGQVVWGEGTPTCSFSWPSLSDYILTYIDRSPGRPSKRENTPPRTVFFTPRRVISMMRTSTSAKPENFVRRFIDCWRPGWALYCIDHAQTPLSWSSRRTILAKKCKYVLEAS